MHLTEEQQRVVHTRGVPVQVIACAGSGKTESISRRISALIDEGEEPESIVAFTFTEKAAAELKERVYQRVEDLRGRDFLGRLGPMFVGTIHAYCLQLLQNEVPEYGNYDLLDEHRHAGLLSREFYSMDLKRLRGKHWKSIQQFMKEVDVVYNELIDPTALVGTDLGDCLTEYEAALGRFHYLTFGQVIAKAVEVLGDPATFHRVHDRLRHLVVDEYQDINPAQERLIELLAQEPVQLCVVGDDDQSIYQWRGSDVSNIVTFASRWQDTESIRLEANRRSVPGIVGAATEFAASIPGRLEKSMDSVREPGDLEVVPWCAETPAEEANMVADAVERLHEQGLRYADMAVLYRSVRTSAPALLEAFDRKGIPYDCGGRTGLFMQPAICFFGELYAWFADSSWRDERFGEFRDADLSHVIGGLKTCFCLNESRTNELRRYIGDWHSFLMRGHRPVNLVGDYYKLLEFLGVGEIDPDTPAGATKLGVFARFSTVLADFENVNRRGRMIADEEGRTEFSEGRDRGKSFFRQLANYLLHYAKDAYEDFAGEQVSDVDAVNVLTVHQSKGLEWPVVFLPCLNVRRFPSSQSGRSSDWLIPDTVFPQDARARYDGGDSEERRLFYVAMTRARDLLYLSHFERINRGARPSPYIREVASEMGGIRKLASLPIPESSWESRGRDEPPMQISFSDLATYSDCPYRYRLSQALGFENQIAIELGYGRAIHHILRRIAEEARDQNAAPTWDDIQALLNAEFFLPFADKPTYGRMRTAAQWLIQKYTRDYEQDLKRIWATERPFEVNTGDCIVNGRADVILDKEDGQPDRLAIVDYKSSNDPRTDERYAQQLAVYAAAGRGEGLDVVAGYLHDLAKSDRRAVDVSDAPVAGALEWVQDGVAAIRAGHFPSNASHEKCETCDYRSICRFTPAEAAP